MCVRESERKSEQAHKHNNIFTERIPFFVVIFVAVVVVFSGGSISSTAGGGGGVAKKKKKCLTQKPLQRERKRRKKSGQENSPNIEMATLCRLQRSFRGNLNEFFSKQCFTLILWHCDGCRYGTAKA